MNGYGTKTAGTGNGRWMRCALFVDFDNVYQGLRQLDPKAAEAFASNPARWLERLENGRDAEGEFRRRFLVRACYLNPSVSAHFRPFFTRAGFRVIDCPSLTQQGKSSAGLKLQPPMGAKEPAEGWAGNVGGPCHGARMELGDDGQAQVRAWVGGA